MAGETEDLLQLLHLSIEYGDIKKVNAVVAIEAILNVEDSKKNFFDALAKYNEQGKIDFALHNAIEDKNILASLMLVQHTKNINARNGYEHAWISLNSSVSHFNKTPLELSLAKDMKEIIFYLLTKNADPYLMREIKFLFEGKDNLDYFDHLVKKPNKTICAKTKRGFFLVNPPITISFIGDVIAKNRLDIIEMLQQIYPIDWRKVCCTVKYHNSTSSYTPLQFSLLFKRYDIAQYLINMGVKIE
jgi:uncharacterized pyridoxamine 5'-phosphate oxidase family protein